MTLLDSSKQTGISLNLAEIPKHILNYRFEFIEEWNWACPATAHVNATTRPLPQFVHQNYKLTSHHAMRAAPISVIWATRLENQRYCLAELYWIVSQSNSSFGFYFIFQPVLKLWMPWSRHHSHYRLLPIRMQQFHHVCVYLLLLCADSLDKWSGLHAAHTSLCPRQR